MGISIKTADVVVNDGLVTDLIGALPAPNHGEKTVITLTHNFDANEASDAPWIARVAKYAAQLEIAQKDLADAQEIGDKALEADASNEIKRITIGMMGCHDTAFGIATRVDGKTTYSKGSFLDRVVKAVNELNKRTVWLAGDVVSVNHVDVPNHRVNVVRQAKSMKRTRVMRPTLASEAAKYDADLAKYDASNETSAE